MFRTMKICILFTILVTEACETFENGQKRQYLQSVDPVMVRNFLNTGTMMVQLGKQGLRELSDLTGVKIGGDLLFSTNEMDRNQYYTDNLDTKSGLSQGSTDPIMAKNILKTGKIFVKLGKQGLRKLSDLAGVQIGGDLLFSSYETDQNVSFVFSTSSNTNSSLPSTTTSNDTQKYPTVPNTKPNASPATNLTNVLDLGAKNNNEIIYQPNSLPVPQLLENAVTPQTPISYSVPSPPYKGSYNPLALDDFHAPDSLLNPTSESYKMSDSLLYPVQFYNPETLQVSNMPETPEEKPSNHQSNYDNFDAW